jgi:hypothetical protein
MTLKVHHKDTTVEWITMKRSSKRNGGFGIFACRTFNVGELVTVFLGEMVPVMYCFQDIIAIQPKKMDAFMMNIGLPIESITKVETFQIAE